MVFTTACAAFAVEVPTKKLFAQHCTECHDADSKKGNLDLTSLQPESADAENFARWVKVHDRIAADDMPPLNRARPAAAALFPEDVEIQKRAPKPTDSAAANATPAKPMAPGLPTKPVTPSGPPAPSDPGAPAPLPFGKPGEVIYQTAIPLKQPKKSADRAEGGPNHVLFTLWIPEGLKTVRGIYHTPFNLDTVEKEQSRAMARNWGFALVRGNFMRVNKAEIGPAFVAGLAELAAKSGHPELAHAPLIFSSMSAGTGMCLALAEHLPDRTLACGLVALEVGPETLAVRDVPMLTLFGSKDGRQMPQLEALLPRRRAEFDPSWAIAVQWGRGHEWGQANNLLWPFFDEIIRQRFPADAAPASGP